MGPGDKESGSWKVGGYFGVFAVVMLNLSVPGMAVVETSFDDRDCVSADVVAVTGGVTPHGWLSVPGYALPVLGRAYSLGSCYWFSARRGLATWAGVLRLAMAVRAFQLGLTALCIRGRVFPELAGLGKLKANSNVPSIARVSGQCLGRRSIRATGFVPAVSGGWRG